ncbi:hypothetical protein C8A03DRAFT_37152 [Achaetomium macrosporum]|uniref:Uncharacterized protein n=1 Tax=Achaetomium macrosporum TaxID=79813 RepID=A0AAN7HBL9_9PEZI|nr:hypothetical protein C8A03DRAFT_37152 [Achaetomium macrosporum]
MSDHRTTASVTTPSDSEKSNVAAPSSSVPSYPGASHTPVCGCCLAYQAVKNRERVRKALILVHDHVSTTNKDGNSVKSDFQSILIGLTDVCTVYEDAERMLIRAAGNTVPNELKQSAAKLAASSIAAAGRQLDALSGVILELQGAAASKPDGAQQETEQ